MRPCAHLISEIQHIMHTITIRPFLAAKLALFAVAVLFALGACDGIGIRGNGNIVTDTRPASEFTKIEANGALRIEWTPGAPSVKIVTDSNLLAYVDTSVEEGKLVLRSRNNLRPTRHLLVRVSSQALNAAALRGAVRLEARNVAADNFYLDCEGATRVELSGRTNGLLANLEGASKLGADSFQTRTTEMSISGAGKAEVYATEKLQVAISGAGKVTYSGNPKVIDKRVSGAGSIRERQ